jgi:HD domain
MVTQITALDRLNRQQERDVTQLMATMLSADARVVAVKVADRLHNMQTLQFLPQEKQLRRAREVLDLFVPAARQLNMDTIGSELEALAFAALIRNRSAAPLCRRAIVALDIERSTSRPDPVKAELRVMLYELFDAALRSADIYPCHRDQFIDRGDGLLALIHPADCAPETLLVNQVVPVLSRFLTSYNASLPPQRQLRVRVVVHEGEVHYDANGCFGEALDVAFRLLDAPRVKMALKTAQGSLLLVVSSDVYRSVVRHGYDGTRQRAFHRLVSADIAGKRHPGWIHIPAQPA